MSGRSMPIRSIPRAQRKVSQCHLVSPNVTSSSRNESNEAITVSTGPAEGDVSGCLPLSRSVTCDSRKEPIEPTGLSPRQVLAARMMGRGLGVVGVARRLGIHRRTVARWKLLAAFQDEIQRALE